MSRFREGDYEGEPEEILAQGRWEHNARRALKGKRGRKALADLRAALLALPEPRLIEGALQDGFTPAILRRLEAALRWRRGSARARASP